MSVPAQIRELGIAYGLSAVAMLIGLLLMRADRRAYFRWPVYSVMAMALSVVLWNLMRKHWLPAEWLLTKPNALYYGALMTYAGVGFAFGLLLGRLTGRKTAPESESSTE